MINHLALRWDLWDEHLSRVNGISPEQLEVFCALVISEPEESLVDLGVNRERAVLLPGAASLYRSVCLRSGAHAVLLPCVSLIDGLLIDSAERGQNWSGHNQTNR
jgi:hypothetical protein